MVSDVLDVTVNYWKWGNWALMLKSRGVYYTCNIEILSDWNKKSGCVLYLGCIILGVHYTWGALYMENYSILVVPNERIFLPD